MTNTHLLSVRHELYMNLIIPEQDLTKGKTRRWALDKYIFYIMRNTQSNSHLTKKKESNKHVRYKIIIDESRW